MLPSITDPKIKLFNPEYFEYRLNEEMARAKRYNIPTSVILFQFSSTNDTEWKLDYKTQKMIELAKKEIRQTDIFGTLGENMFGIMLPHTNVCGATILAKRIRKIMKKHGYVFSAIVIDLTCDNNATAILAKAEKTLSDLAIDGVDEIIVENENPNSIDNNMLL